MARSRTLGSPERAVLLAAALIGAALLLQQLLSVVLATVVMLVIAIPLSAGTTWLERHRVPRALGAAVLLLLGLGLLTGLLVLLVPTLVDDINGFIDAVPSITHDLRHGLRQLTGASPDEASRRVQHLVRNVEAHPVRLLGPLAQIGLGLVGAIAALVVVLLTALYTAIRPQPLVDGALALFPPAHRSQVQQVLTRIRAAWLAWLRGLSVAMLLIGVFVWIGLTLVGLRFAPFFAILSALFEVVPFFGALASGAPAVMFAFTYSPGKALAVFAVFLLAHQLDGNVISPLVMARAVRLHPVVVAIGIIVVERLLGFLGLIIAVPLISATVILVDELWVKRLKRRDPPAGAARALPAADDHV